MEEQATSLHHKPPKPPTIDKLATALAKAQGEFQPVAKTGKNPHLKNEYATLDDIISAIRKPLATHGLSFVQLLNSNGDEALTLRTMLLHESGQYIESVVQVHAGSGNRGVNELQALGAAITYMKRYALSAMLGIAADTDGDGEGAKPAPRTQPQRHQSQPTAPAGTRPLPAEAIRNIIRKKAGWDGDTRHTDREPLTEAQQGAVAGLMSKAIRRDGMKQADLDNARYDILDYLVGVRSTKSLARAEASAIIAWLAADVDDIRNVHEAARTEAARILEAMAAEAGQQPLFDDGDDLPPL